VKKKKRATIIQTNNVSEFKCLIEKVDMLISSKMHPAVLGISSFVPTLCIAYDHKQLGLFNHLGMMDLVINIQEVSHKTLLSKISLIWENREKIRTLLQEKVPVLQEEVKRSIEEVLSNFISVQKWSES